MAREIGIIVLGTASASAEDIDELMAAALAHVRRSRAEPGCISHAVSLDVENPNRLMFVEEWSDRAALDTHFHQPGSLEFVEVVGRLASEPPTLEIHNIAPRTGSEQEG